MVGSEYGNLTAAIRRAIAMRRAHFEHGSRDFRENPSPARFTA
jgi:hypothetical protein